jgi:hypothetical protein
MRCGTRSLLAVAIVVAASGGVIPVTFAAEESGIAVAVRQAADVRRVSGQSSLREQAPVFMGDVIKTNRIGEVQIRLSDDTRLVVGPNSLMTIDRFVFNTDTTAKQVSLNAVRGAFRFITGNSRKEAYTITTPTATIGVRGTRLDFSINPDGTSLAVFEGEANMCELLRRDQCEPTISQCGVAVAAPRETIRRIEDEDDRIKVLTELFPFVVDQRRLSPEFQVDTGSCGVPDAAIKAARMRAQLGRNPPSIQRSSDPVTTASVPSPPPPPPPPPPCNLCQ